MTERIQQQEEQEETRQTPADVAEPEAARVIVPPRRGKRDEEEPLAKPVVEPLGYDLEYPIDKKRRRRKQKPVDYAKKGSGKLIFHTYDHADGFVVLVNGKRFAYRRRNLPIGELRIEVRSNFGLLKWYAFLLIFADFFRMLAGKNSFGGSFRRQGIVDYRFEFSMTRRPAAKDVHVYFEQTPRVEGFEVREIGDYTYRVVPKLQRRYDKYADYATPVLFAPLLIALIAALAYFFAAG